MISLNNELAEVSQRTGIHYRDDFNYYKFTISSLLSENNRHILKTMLLYNRFIFGDEAVMGVDVTMQELFLDEGVDDIIHGFDKDSDNMANDDLNADDIDDGTCSH